jgi:hypothetical protein
VSIEISEYKGHPTITLQDDENEKCKITFGVRKAKLILAHLAEGTTNLSRNQTSKEF